MDVGTPDVSDASNESDALYFLRAAMGMGGLSDDAFRSIFYFGSVDDETYRRLHEDLFYGKISFKEYFQLVSRPDDNKRLNTIHEIILSCTIKPAGDLPVLGVGDLTKADKIPWSEETDRFLDLPSSPTISPSTTTSPATSSTSWSRFRSLGTRIIFEKRPDLIFHPKLFHHDKALLVNIFKYGTRGLLSNYIKTCPKQYEQFLSELEFAGPGFYDVVVDIVQNERDGNILQYICTRELENSSVFLHQRSEYLMSHCEHVDCMKYLLSETRGYYTTPQWKNFYLMSALRSVLQNPYTSSARLVDSKGIAIIKLLLETGCPAIATWDMVKENFPDDFPASERGEHLAYNLLDKILKGGNGKCLEMLINFDRNLVLAQFNNPYTKGSRTKVKPVVSDTTAAKDKPKISASEARRLAIQKKQRSLKVEVAPRWRPAPPNEKRTYISSNTEYCAEILTILLKTLDDSMARDLFDWILYDVSNGSLNHVISIPIFLNLGIRPNFTDDNKVLIMKFTDALPFIWNIKWLPHTAIYFMPEFKTKMEYFLMIAHRHGPGPWKDISWIMGHYLHLSELQR